MARDKFKLVAIYALFLLCGSVVALLIYFFQIFNQSEFLPGVEIAGLSVQGLSTKEAAALVQNMVDKTGSTEIVFYNNDYVYKTKLGNLCQPTDAVSIVQGVWKQEQHRNWTAKIFNLDGSQKVTYPANIKYNSKAISNMIAEWSKYLATECKNASLGMNRQSGLIVIPGQNGKVIDRGPTLSQLPQRWEDINKPLRISIILKEQKPVVDAKALSNMGQLSEFSTLFSPQEVDRSHNLATASAAINTSAVAPNAIFSFNNTVGERIAAKGYRDAMVIVQGKFEPGLGGGVCQVSSTLYNACLLAGLNIVERHNHTLSVSYVPLGRDATVAYGIQDFRFRNNTGYPVYIRSIVSGAKLTITIYGHLAFKQKIELSSVVDQVNNFKTIEEPDATLQPGTQKIDHKGLPGYIVRSFRTFYDATGKVVRKEQLARDTYQPLDKVVHVGPAAVQPVTPPESQPNPEPIDLPPANSEPPAQSSPGDVNNSGNI